MITWMTDSGLKVNDEKTEICVFNKRDIKSNHVDVNGKVITVSKSIKVLGIIFDSKRTWSEHVHKAILSANKSKQAIQLISRFFHKEEILRLATSFFYSKLYYGAKVWLISTLKADLKKKIWQASSYMLKIV